MESTKPQHGQEWVSIADLMSGVVGVMVALFAVAVLQANNAKAEAERQRQEKEALKQQEARQEEQRLAGERDAMTDDLTKAFERIRGEIESQRLENLIDVDVYKRHIRLKEATFALGSACVRRPASSALQRVAHELHDTLQKYPEHEIFIEGHSDSTQLSDVRCGKEYCGCYDDNFMLSTARARQARAVLVELWQDERALQDRVVLAGYGDSRPLEKVKRNDGAQRRVEISVRPRVDTGTISRAP